MARIKQRLLFLSILLAGLGLYSPIYQKIYQAYIGFSDDHIKPGFELPPEVIVELEPKLNTSVYGSYENQLKLKTEQPPQKLADRAEVIFVSGYEPDRNPDSGNRIKVKIDRPDKNVLLVLSNYESVIWEIEATPNTHITGILQGSYEPSAVVTTSPTQGFLVDISYADNSDINFVKALKQLNKWLAIEKVDTFIGQYSIPASITISELDPPHPSLTLKGYSTQKPEQNFEFSLYNRNYIPSRWTLEGAIDSGDRHINTQAKIAVSPDEREIYQFTEEGIKVIERKTGKQKEYKLPNKFPELSWATSIAYDSKRDLVAVVSLGGEGYFYRFDVKKRRWLDVRSVSDFDITSLAYDSVSDRYIAWASDIDAGYADGGSLLVISGTGELLKNEYIADKMPEYFRLYDRGNEPEPRVTVKVNGNNVALIGYENDYESNLNVPQAIWHYNLSSKTVQLTYKSNR